MTTIDGAPEAARPRDLGLVLVATFGLAACLTLIWLVAWDPSHREPAPPADTDDAIDRLQRLADLRRRRDITNDEYERFKQALLRDVEGNA